MITLSGTVSWTSMAVIQLINLDGIASPPPLSSSHVVNVGVAFWRERGRAGLTASLANSTSASTASYSWIFTNFNLCCGTEKTDACHKNSGKAAADDRPKTKAPLRSQQWYNTISSSSQSFPRQQYLMPSKHALTHHTQEASSAHLHRHRATTHQRTSNSPSSPLTTLDYTHHRQHHQPRVNRRNNNQQHRSRNRQHFERRRCWDYD